MKDLDEILRLLQKYIDEQGGEYEVPRRINAAAYEIRELKTYLKEKENE